MGIDNFGSVSFTSETKADAFVTYLEKGKVMTTRCRKCGTISFPPKVDCPSCLESDAEWFEVTGPAKLATYTVVKYGPTGFEDDAPYTLGLADFGDFKVFGRVCKDIPTDKIEVGMAVKPVAVRLSGNRVGYEFVEA